ncbi:MAG: universal stress protein [Flavobacteriales bacterium]|nr:universal stress protein [Flavobacteriales bacterium]MCB9193795.1 universal stress protein [Flavobacteriales bacterium]
MKNILAPVDLSPISDTVLEQAGTLAKASGAKVWIVHVAAPDPDFVGFSTGPRYVREHRADTLRHEHTEIQAMADRLRAQGMDAEGLLVQGPTTETLLEEAERLKVDMIVMGSHGRGALFKALVGSVCEQVLGSARIPVLIIPSTERQ